VTSARSSSHNILMIVQNLPVPFDRRVWQEAGTLSRAGFGVTVICPKSKRYAKSYECLYGVHIYRYPLLIESSDSVLGYFLEFTYCWLATLMLAVVAYLRCPFQAIHACNPPDTYFAIALLFRPLGVKFVFDHHDLCPELYVAKGHPPRGVVYSILLLLEQLTFRTADVVVAVNESYRQIARTRGRLSDEKIVVVRSGPRLGWAKVDGPKTDLKQGRKHLVVFLGQIGKQDGVDYLLRAIRIYRRQYGSDTRFVIIGDGPNQRSMQSLAAELDVTDTVEFLGQIDDEQLCLYLSSADICVDPDPCTHFNNCSTMNKIVEYMSFGKPTVAFDLVEHRRSALEAAHYIEPNDVNKFATGVRELLEDEERRQRMARFAKKRFQEVLAWDLTEATLVRTYEELLNGSDFIVPESRVGTHRYSGDPVVVAGKVA
jgi:glycosyltransferase involved in cell wall biosynthesis